VDDLRVIGRAERRPGSPADDGLEPDGHPGMLRRLTPWGAAVR
jgi:hypothetical protein